MMLRVQAVALLRRALAHAVYASFEVAAHPRLLLSFVSDSWNEYLNLKSSDVVVSRVSAWLLYLHQSNVSFSNLSPGPVRPLT